MREAKEKEKTPRFGSKATIFTLAMTPTAPDKGWIMQQGAGDGVEPRQQGAQVREQHVGLQPAASLEIDQEIAHMSVLSVAAVVAAGPGPCHRGEGGEKSGTRLVQVVVSTKRFPQSALRGIAGRGPGWLLLSVSAVAEAWKNTSDVEE